MATKYQVIGVREGDKFLGFNIETVVKEAEKGVLYATTRYTEYLNKATLHDSQRSFSSDTLENAYDLLSETCYDVYWEEI